MIQYDMVQYGVVQYGIQYGMVPYDMVQYGMVWYSMVWYSGAVQYNINVFIFIFYSNQYQMRCYLVYVTLNVQSQLRWEVILLKMPLVGVKSK